ncbi:MAG: HAMP domain-containing sensor histidine kinase [Acidobacteriota bacterium]
MNDAGLALRCDGEGSIEEVLRDGLGLGAAPGRRFSDLVDPACAAKAKAFLGVLRSQGAAFNWELNATTEAGQVESLHFAGGASGGAGFLVVGARSRSAVTRVYEELVRINNDQATALRAALKDVSLQLRGQEERDSRHYDELSRLNNDLATTQRELAKSNVALGVLNRQKNEFLGIAAHDLRNPLEVILTYSRFLLDEAAGSLDPEHLEFVRTIRSSSEFMLRLVEDLLDVARIESGTLELDLTAVDLGALVERNVALNRVLAGKKGTRIELRCDPSLPPLVLDEAKIEQVLNNLIGNAVKYSPPGSTVEVRVEDGPEGAAISVRDQGQGLMPEEIERLFHPFERGRARSTAGEKSTGLGLAIVKRIVEGHRGEVRVESAEGGGAVFRVLLPRAAAPVLAEVGR